MNKIAFIHPSFPFGGAERVTIDIVNELLKRYDYEFYIFTPIYAPERMTRIENPNRFHVVTQPNNNAKHRNDWNFVIDNVKIYNIDVVVFVGMHIPGLVDNLHQLGCKTIYANHGVPFWEAKYKRDRKRLQQNNKKHNIWKKLEYYLFQYIRYEVLNTLDAECDRMYRDDLNQHDAYTVLVDEYKQDIVSRLKMGEDIVAIPNMERMVNNVNFDKKNQFLYVGRLSFADKRVDRLINAWRIVAPQLPDWTLTIVGEGNDSENLHHQAEGLPRITFTGYRKDTEIFYHTASAICLVSKLEESWGLVLTEAQAAGVVPIAMDCSAGVRYIVSPDGVNGFLAGNGDIEGFAEKMLHFARLSEDEKLRLRHNVVKKALDYSPDIVAEKWHSLFTSLIGK